MLRRREVDLERDRATAVSLNALDDVAGVPTALVTCRVRAKFVTEAKVGNDNGNSLCSQLACCRGTDAVVGARDDRDPAFQPGQRTG
jgi:hypothetical protein